VQHGASTLPDVAFSNFPKRETAEIHLATNFQTMMFDHLPPELLQEIYAWLDVNAKDERKATDSDAQFYYKTRKKAIGPFKKTLWALPVELREKLGVRRQVHVPLHPAGYRRHEDVRGAVRHHAGTAPSAPHGSVHDHRGAGRCGSFRLSDRYGLGGRRQHGLPADSLRSPGGAPHSLEVIWLVITTTTAWS
jgi:hypothetical protein